MDVNVTEMCLNGGLKTNLERREVLGREKPTMFTVIICNRLGDVTLIKGIAGSPNAGLATLRRSCSFFVRHVLQATAKIFLNEQLTWLGWSVIRQVDRGIRWPATVRFLVFDKN